MKTRVTFLIDKLVVKKAKAYAKLHKISLSDLIGEYLKLLLNNPGNKLTKSKNPARKRNS
jgi:Family of unknown function (DUF6364)